MNADGSYTRLSIDPDTPAMNAQTWFLRERATPRLG
jgi:hypothetical protein